MQSCRQFSLSRSFTKFLFSLAFTFATASGHGASSSSSAPSVGDGYGRLVYCAGVCAFSGTRYVSLRAYTAEPTSSMTATRLVTEQTVCSPAAFGMSVPPQYRYYECSYTEIIPRVTGLIATASNQSGKTRSASKAVDGLTETRWEASNTTAGAWLRVDLPQPTVLSRLVISEFEYRIWGFRLEYLDGTTWTTIQAGTGNMGQLRIDLPNVTAKAVRLVTTGRASAQPSISEIELFGKPNPVGTVVDKTIVVGPNQVFDGGGKNFIVGAGIAYDNTGNSIPSPMFDLQPGASLRNLSIYATRSTGQLVVTRGNATLDNVRWPDITRTSSAVTGKGSGTVRILHNSVDDFRGTFFFGDAPGIKLQAQDLNIARVGGSIIYGYITAGKMEVEIDSSNLRGASAIYSSDSTASTVKMSNTRYCIPTDTLFRGLLAENITLSNNTACPL